ncbi:hypothetical protein GQ44DRAFT_700026 [Phaeosphaeriaceae sp. PMI808]|nr:hypothetical protein GQ44DRAFT_700026 [Phaeosphaeriaceae sp. PMI808]
MIAVSCARVEPIMPTCQRANVPTTHDWPQCQPNIPLRFNTCLLSQCLHACMTDLASVVHRMNDEM